MTVRPIHSLGGSVYIKSLSADNLRCFREVKLDLQYPGRLSGAAALPNVNLLIGNNGAGKTTVLKALALASLSPVLESSGFVPYRLVRRADNEQPPRATMRATVVLHAQDLGSKDRRKTSEEEVGVAIERIRDVELLSASRKAQGYWENLYDERSPAFLVVGYGANRRVEASRTYDEGLRRRSRQLRYERVAGLFEEQATLTPLGSWLPRLRSENSGRYRQVVNLIDQLLPEDCHFTGDLEEGETIFTMRGAPVPFAALSDGYRAYIGWITDLLYHVWLGTPSGAKLVDSHGVALIDEIDLHLHPEWQRVVVPRLATALPNMQFVLTSHSPIVAGTLQSRNIWVSESDDSGASVLHQLEEPIHGLSAEQILLSSYFNLPTTRAPAAEDELSAIAREARSGDTKAAVEYLKRLTEGSDPLVGSTKARGA